MKLCEAVSIRIREYLKERKITQYRLEQDSGITHATLNCLLNCRYKGCNLTTVMIIIRTLNITTSQFFDSPLFESENLELE